MLPASAPSSGSRVPRAWALAAGAAAAAATAVAVVSWRRARRRRLAVRVSSAYAEAVVREAAARLRLAVDAAAPLQWADFQEVDWDGLLADGGHRRRCSCLYLRAGLVRKAMLAHYLAKRRAAGVLPEGVVVDLEDEADLADLRRQLEERQAGAAPGARGRPLWIAKASCSNRGEHIFLARSAEEAVEALRPAVLEEGIAEWVVQRYISPPLLLGGRKFHVRAHFLVSGCPRCGTTSAWLHAGSHVVLVAGEAYGEGAGERLSHLTNHCLQAADPRYDEGSQTLLLGELDAAAAREGLAAHALAEMAGALSRALAAAASAPATFAPLPQCFELFGADFVLEDRGTGAPGVWLLEVNSGPDLSVFGSRLRPQCVELVEGVLRVAVEPFLGRSPAGDFADPKGCGCASRALRSGFGECLWSCGPRTGSGAEELSGFKRRISLAGKWAKALHEGSSIAVRGPQGRVG